MNPYADSVAGIYSEAGQAWQDGLNAAVSIIDQHIPSLIDEDEIELEDLRYNTDIDRLGLQVIPASDLAIRTCACGVKIDGFYGYVDHIKDELRKANVV